MLLLPGIEGDARACARLEPLSRYRPVFAFDHPQTAGTLHELARAVLVEFPVERMVVFGSSFGGVLGRAMAEIAPERVVGLVALGSLPSPAFIPSALARTRRWSGRLPSALYEALYRRRIEQRLREEGVASGLTSMLLDGLPTQREHLARLDAVLAWGLQPTIDVPAMWLRGQLDTETLWQAGEVSGVLPRVAAETVPGGHRAPLTHPEHLMGLIQSFIRRVLQA